MRPETLVFDSILCSTTALPRPIRKARLDRLLAQHEKERRHQLTEICVGIASLRLPALVQLQIAEFLVLPALMQNSDIVDWEIAKLCLQHT